MDFTSAMESVGKVIDVAGVAAIVVGAAVATVTYLRSRAGWSPAGDAYRSYRQALGRSILLGLELLVAADIVRTVAAEPTFESVGVLGLIVVIRTFLSFTLDVEITGRWPWQERESG